VKHDILRVVKTISVRDLRQRWPEAEALLQVEEEIVITRDARPVAKLVRVAERPRPRKRFDPAAHARWQRKVAGGKIARWVDRAVREARDDRRPVRRRR
jgi:antitoxin (DNA-binding transcriptional repressor) of toxin-antitoxin stability system